MSEITLILRSVLSLALVVGLVLGFGRIARKRANAPRSPHAAPTAVGVQAKIPLGKGQSLITVTAGDHRYLLGVTSSNISLITELAEIPLPSEHAEETVESIDLRQFDNPDVELLSQWGDRRPPIFSSSPGATWMAFLGQIKGARAQR